MVFCGFSEEAAVLSGWDAAAVVGDEAALRPSQGAAGRCGRHRGMRPVTGVMGGRLRCGAEQSGNSLHLLRREIECVDPFVYLCDGSLISFIE